MINIIIENIKKVEKHLAWIAVGGGLWLLWLAFNCFSETDKKQFWSGFYTEIGSALVAFGFIYFIWRHISISLAAETQEQILKNELANQNKEIKNEIKGTSSQIGIIHERLNTLPEEVHDVLALDKKIAQLHKELNKNNKLRKELISSIEHFTLIHGSESEIANNKIPLHVVELFKNETMKKLAELNDALEKCKAGELSLEEIDCVNATIQCMLYAKNNVFAISFPDIHFWEDQGKSYLNANRKSILDNGVEVSRFFVIRDSILDRRVLENEEYTQEFVEVLKDQLAINSGLKKGSKGKMRVFITDVRLLNLNKIQEGLRYVPDISLYDDETVSEWQERGGFSDHENKIQTSVISYQRERLNTAKKTKQYFMQHAHSLCIEIGNGVSPEAGIEMLKEKLKKAGKA